MTQHIKIMRLVFIFSILFLFNCKKYNSQITNERSNDIPEKSSIKESRNNWVFYKRASLSRESNYSCDIREYESLQIDVSNDSIFINNHYTDNVYSGIILAEKYFKQKYLYNAYKKILKKEFNITISNKISYIRNKKANDKTSELDKYFQDAFFIDNYMFFEKGGCVFCFIKKSNEIRFTSRKFSVSISKNDFLNSNIELPIINKKIFIDDSEASTVYKLTNDIFLLWFDGDNEKWYIVTFVNDKLFDKLLIGKSETVELENGKTIDNYIDFNIDKDFKIKLEYSSGENFNVRKIKKTENYFINFKNKKIEVL